MAGRDIEEHQFIRPLPVVFLRAFDGIARVTKLRGGMAVPLAVPLFLFVWVAFPTLTLPIDNAFSRRLEAEADWEARIDHLMDEQNTTLDYSARKKDFDEVQEIIAEQQPMIFTVTPIYYAAIRSDIGNVRATPLSSYRATWNAEELYFKR